MVCHVSRNVILKRQGEINILLSPTAIIDIATNNSVLKRKVIAAVKCKMRNVIT